MRRDRLVLLDLDGTLVDLNADSEEIEDLRAVVLQHARGCGLIPPSSSILGTYQEVVRERGFTHQVSHQLRLDLDTFESRWAQRSSAPRPGVDLLGLAPAEGVMLGIVTNNGRRCLDVLFERGLLRREQFDVVVTRNDSQLLKPAPEPIQLSWSLARELVPGFRAAWFAGDSDHDRRAAEAFNRAKPSTRLQFVKLGSEDADYPDLGSFLQEVFRDRSSPL